MLSFAATNGHPTARGGGMPFGCCSRQVLMRRGLLNFLCSFDEEDIKDIAGSYAVEHTSIAETLNMAWEASQRGVIEMLPLEERLHGVRQ